MISLYGKYRETTLNAGISISADNIGCLFVTAGYVPNFSTDKFVSIIGSSNILGRTSALTGKTTTLGTFKCDNPTFTGIPVGSTPGVAVVLYKNTGDDSTSNLIAYIDNVQQLTVAVAANSGATSVQFDPLKNPIVAGTVLTKVSGTGPSSITISNAMNKGDRVATVTALTDAISVNAVYKYGSMSTTPDGKDIPIMFDPNGIFSI